MSKSRPSGGRPANRKGRGKGTTHGKSSSSASPAVAILVWCLILIPVLSVTGLSLYVYGAL